MSAYDELVEKLQGEFTKFTTELKGKPPGIIIDNAYDYLFKEDIVSLFERSKIVNDDDAALLLTLREPLEELFSAWGDTDPLYLDHLRDCIVDTVSTVRAHPERFKDSFEKETPVTATGVNGKIHLGDWVIAMPTDDYRYLIGTVTAIDKLGTPEHGTQNETDDVHVDFNAFDYPHDRITEIEAHFSDLYGEPKTFDELPLDDVIMAPDDLTCITELGYDEINRLGSLQKTCEYFCSLVSNLEPESGKHAELLKRLDDNYDVYTKSLMGFGKGELIEMAGKISAVTDAYNYMCYYAFNDNELDYFLKFQNPLEVVSDAWNTRNEDLDDMRFVLHSLFDRQDALIEYPLIDYHFSPMEGNLRRFMGIDVIDFLGTIAGKTITHYPGDFKIDMDILNKAAASDDPDMKRLMWHVSGWGTHLNTERETFIKDTGAYNTWVDYRPNDPDMLGYIIEIIDKEGGLITGNVFEVGNYADYAAYVRETALPLDSVSLTYSNEWGANAGKTITVPRYEYDKDRHRLMSESGDVAAIRYHPSESVRNMETLLQVERSRRMVLPIGSIEAHLGQLDKKLSEIRSPSEKPEIDGLRSPTEIPEQPELPELAALKPRLTLSEKLKAANDKAKAQETANNNIQSHKREKESEI